jgi:hypothetical protein
MAAKKPAKKRKKKTVAWACPNPGRSFSLWALVGMLQNEPDFADFFFPKLKDALDNDPGAITCVESYLAPTDEELIELGIPMSQVGSHKICTDSELLVAVVANEHSQPFPKVGHGYR